MVATTKQGAIRPSYKQTDVGAIPEDWEIVQFANLLEFRNGVNADKQAYGKGTPFINVLEVITHSHIRSSEVPGRVTLPRDVIALFAVRRGDLIFNRTSETQEEVGLSAVYQDDVTVVFGGFVIRGRPKDASLDATYSGYALRSLAVRSQIISKGQGAIRANIGQADLRQVCVPLPPIPEQHAIAAAQSDVDALIASLDELIAKKRDVKSAATQQLLSGKQRLPGFSGKWEVKTLGELLTYEQPGKYLVKRAEYSDHHRTPVLTAGKTFILGYTSEEDGVFDKVPTIIFDDFTTASRYVEFPFKAKSSAMKMLSTRSDAISLRFMFERMQLLDFMLGDHKRYWISEYQNLEVEIPEPGEQAAIALVLADLDAEIAVLETRREKTQALKQGMMQQLLTGNIRLI
jgi:type I restriction enzyme S subunit